jgi:hypothetical protein
VQVLNQGTREVGYLARKRVESHVNVPLNVVQSSLSSQENNPKCPFIKRTGLRRRTYFSQWSLLSKSNNGQPSLRSGFFWKKLDLCASLKIFMKQQPLILHNNLPSYNKKTLQALKINMYTELLSLVEQRKF